MGIRLSLIGLVAIAGCIGGSGPNLPPNVGANHPETSGADGDEDGEDQPPAEPVAVGTGVWADYHDSGFYFHGVVVDRREEMHRVIYDDGANEWLPPDALRPDSLGEEAHVHVRMRFEGEFQAAIVARRLGRALYVRLANGDERWTTLPHVRFQESDEGIPQRGQGPYTAPNATAPAVGSDVLVNYQLQGLRFAGTVTAHRDDRQLHVVYLDGEAEWTDPALVSPDDLGPGSIVHVRRSWQPARWVRGRVQERMGAAMRVEFDDGGTAWTSLFRIRAPVDESTDRTDAVPEGAQVIEPEPEPAPAEEAPRRRGRRRAPPAETPPSE